MGLEKACRVTLEGKNSQGKAHCGDGEISFQGEFKFRWLWRDIATLVVSKGVLKVARKGKTASFDLGSNTDKWLAAIKNPKGRLDKLCVKDGSRYSALGEFDDDFAPELLARAGKPSASGLDIAFVRLDSKRDLPKLLKAKKMIAQNGMVWAVWPKGRKELKEDDIREFALKNGLADVKVASFSATLSALKFVIPVKIRK